MIFYIPEQLRKRQKTYQARLRKMRKTLNGYKSESGYSIPERVDDILWWIRHDPLQGEGFIDTEKYETRFHRVHGAMLVCRPRDKWGPDEFSPQMVRVKCEKLLTNYYHTIHKYACAVQGIKPYRP